MSQKFKSDIETQAGLIDSFGFTGTAGQVLSSTGTKTEWITPPQTPGGGGSSQVFYFNGGTVSSVGGYYQMSPVANTGTAADFSINANGYIASFLTDVASPNQLNIPAGNWNFEIYFNASSSGGSPSFYVELYKYSSGGVFTLIASSSAAPEGITNGTAIDAYFTPLAVPATTLLVTDRLAVRVYVTHSGRTITMHTQNGHLSEVITTFSTGLTALNGLTKQVQYFAPGTAGTDFNISSATDTHTFNLPTASAVNRGALSSADWTTFNSKANASGTTNYVSKFTGANSLGNSLLYDNGTNVGIGTTSPFSKMEIAGPATNWSNSPSITLTDNAGTVNSRRWLIGNVATDYGSLNFAVSTTNSDNPTNPKMTITKEGNVGIGTTSPSQKLEINGTAYASSDFRAPIFYDSNNTAYYTDPASTSNLASTYIAGHYYGSGNSSNILIKTAANSSEMGILGQSSSGAFRFQLYGDAGSYGFLNGDWAAWDIRKGVNSNMYLNNQSTYYYGTDTAYLLRAYGTADMRAPIFYDLDNTGYYINPASTSNINVLTTNGNVTFFNQLAVENQSTFARLAFNKLTFWDWQGSVDVVTIDNGYLEATNSLRAPIFYDSNDTGYYLDPNGTSNLSSVVTRASITNSGGHGNSYIQNELPAANNGLGTGIVTLRMWCSEPNQSWDGAGFGYNVYNDGTGAYNFGRPNTNFGQAYMRMVSNGTWYFLTANTSGTRYTNMELNPNGNVYFENIAQSQTSLRAPIFYDTANTAYYLDPAGTSKLNTAEATGYVYASNYVQSATAMYSPIYYDGNNSAYYVDGSSTGDSIRCAGDIVAYYSDERLKDKKGNIENALEKVLSLNGFYYEPNEKAQELGYKKRLEVGVSAQEVEAVLPELIRDAPIGQGYKTLDYGKLTPLLIEAIKEQQKQIEELKELVNKLINK